MKQDRQFELLALFPEWIEPRVVGKELLSRRVDFAHPMQPEIFDASDFLQRNFLLPWIDHAKTHEHIGVSLHTIRHMVGTRKATVTLSF